jgi:hypothetical protein
MKTKHVIKEARDLAKPYRVTNGAKFRLKDWDPGDTMGLKSEDKPRAKEALPEWRSCAGVCSRSRTPPPVLGPEGGVPNGARKLLGSRALTETNAKGVEMIPRRSCLQPI